MTERLSIDEVSRIIGESPQSIRNKCRYDMYDPPICRKQKHPNGKQYTYCFYRDMVDRYVGKENV